MKMVFIYLSYNLTHLYQPLLLQVRAHDDPPRHLPAAAEQQDRGRPLRVRARQERRRGHETLQHLVRRMIKIMMVMMIIVMLLLAADDNDNVLSKSPYFE